MYFAKPFIVATLSCLLLISCASQQQSTSLKSTSLSYPFELSIAHINDTHSAFDPVAASFAAEGEQVFNEFGGHPRLLSQINEYRQQAQQDDRSLLFLHGGDAWQGTAYFKVNEGRMNADILSQMGIDAMALGNHEFDLNNTLLNQFIEDINFPVLAANIDTSQDPDLKEQRNLKPYTVFAFDGYQKTKLDDLRNLPQDKHLVAVLGIALDDMPSIAPNTGEVEFFNMAESAQATVDEIQALGIQNIIAVTHLGHAVDVEIASQVNGIALIVGGHSHSLLGDFSNLNLGRNATYAQQIDNPDGQGRTCVVQAGEYAQAIGKVRVRFEQDGNLLSCEGGNRLLSGDNFYRHANRQAEQLLDSDARQAVLNFIERQPNIRSIDEDEALRTHIDTHYKPAVEAAYGPVIAMVPEPLRHVRRPGDDGSNEHGSAVAPIVAHAQYAWARSPEVVAIAGLRADLALVGAGGIRTSINEGELRAGDITLELLPFANFMSIVPLRGSVIKALLHSTIKQTLPEGAHAGKYPYPGNLRYHFQETEAGQDGRLLSVDINQGTLEQPRWRRLQDNVLYNVAMNSYNATGNDGWDAVYEAQKENTNRVDLAYVDGNLQAFEVSHISKSGDRLEVHYANEALNCDAEHIHCNTDALAVVEFVSNQPGPLLKLAEPVVRLQRKNSGE
ncbi:bifunctional metallophosphatase/5'-nucleotidase [Aliidiomarina minuta]|uniref:Bifunctional metallophosphatase/5'-nucleotidase n=1 Tax=Aliidiomarina minuta TaxID=880057 RepID=A0A432W9A3_9GAMM|nr:bifunctional metallophosphatase/5'-nucleotidase [Aliidiomarina minuta]RUO26704.1 bifunctional metallophosphatase/5'-nucleotidase [Aliidiomarina minuta]